MSTPERLTCQNCGARVERPTGFTRPKIRCPECGYYADTPPEWRSESPEATPESCVTPTPTRRAKGEQAAKLKPAVARRRADPRDTRPDFEPDETGGVPLLVGTQDEDDEKPYGVPGTGLKPCPECNMQLPLDATLCVNCGRDLVGGGSKAGRTHQPMSGTWQEGLPTSTRLAILGGLQVVNVALAVFLLTTTSPLTAGDVITQFLFQVMHVGLQVFLVGSFDTLSVKRNSKKSVVVTKVRRVAFYPMAPAKLPWKQSTNIGVVPTHDVGIFTWFVFSYLLLPGVLPGIAFYFLVMRPDRYSVRLCDVHGSTDEVLFVTKDAAQASEICDFVAEATGLVYRPL